LTSKKSASISVFIPLTAMVSTSISMLAMLKDQRKLAITINIVAAILMLVLTRLASTRRRL